MSDSSVVRRSNPSPPFLPLHWYIWCVVHIENALILAILCTKTKNFPLNQEIFYHVLKFTLQFISPTFIPSYTSKPILVPSVGDIIL